MMVGKELLDRLEIKDNSTSTPKATSQKYLVITKAHENSVFSEAIARICNQIYISIARNRSTEK